MRIFLTHHGDILEWVSDQRLLHIQAAAFGMIFGVAVGFQSEAAAASPKLSPRDIEIFQVRGEGWLKSASAECMVDIAEFHRLDLSARDGADLLSFTAGVLLSAMDVAHKRVARAEGTAGEEFQKAVAEKERLRRDRVQRYPSCTFAKADRADPSGVYAPLAGALAPQRD